MPPSPLPPTPSGHPRLCIHLTSPHPSNIREGGEQQRITRGSLFPGPPVVTATGNRWFVPHEKRSCDIVERGVDRQGLGVGDKGNRRWNSHREGIDRDRLRSS
ncbi:hypothetical protein CDAR_556741 [Caerostris darwini]|uniref:Uncharacterized protein n=1 Tax=Caerostris darwini TaxID=1538125 RepID=A0AAV4WNY7_9ARAC|nr:hypothetical protein CDAR_556741 [Caerostris darwini]